MSIVTFQHQPVQHLSRYVIACIVAALVFVTLLLLANFIPAMDGWDRAASAWVQQLRNPVADEIMLGVTLMGDVRVGTYIVLYVLLCLLSARRWWLSVHLASVSLSAVLCVSIFKRVLGRARPELNDGALGSFSFPSGHACTAALICGLLALLIGYRQRPSVRYTIYAVAAVLAVSVAFSRVYLLAHWPTDVLAGLALGYTLIVAFAWQLHVGMTLEIHYLTPLLLAASITIVAVHIALTYSEQALRYGLSALS